MAGDPNHKDNLAHEEILVRSGSYEFKYAGKDNVSYISVISDSITLDAPQVEIQGGGLNCQEVHMKLNHPDEGKWACKIEIYTYHNKKDEKENCKSC